MRQIFSILRFIVLALFFLLTSMRVAIGVPASLATVGDFPFSDPVFENVGDTKSIIGGQVTALAQDTKGWLWIGTQSGLVGFDGYRFHTFVHDDKNPASLPDDWVTALWASPDGKLWIGTSAGGLSVLDPQTGRFTNTKNDPARPDSIVGGKIRALVGDAAGGVWIGTSLGLDYCPRVNGVAPTFRHASPDGNPAKPLSVFSLLLGRNGALWVGTADGLLRGEQDSNRLVRVASDSAATGSLAGQAIRTLFEAADGKFWLGMPAQDAVWLDVKTQRLNRPTTDFLAPNGRALGFIKAIAQPQVDQIWLGITDGSIAIVDAADGRLLRRIRHAPAVSTSLSPSAISTLFTDRSGLLWVGTVAGGLQRHQPGSGAFRMLRHSPARPASLSVADVHSVLEVADGSILVGTGGNGIDVLDRQRGLIGGHRPVPGRPGALTDGTILTLAQTGDGAVWAGSHQTGAFRLDPGTKMWRGYGTAQGLPSTDVRQLVVARDGTLWAGTGTGIARWVPRLQRFEVATQADGTALSAGAELMVEVGAGRIWIGGFDGLWAKLPGAPGFQEVTVALQWATSAVSTKVEGLLADRQGQVWVSTPQGLYRLTAWEGTRPVFEHIHSLKVNKGKKNAENLLDDHLGRIWSPDFIFDPKTMRLNELTSADGIDVGTSWSGYGRTRDGLLLFGGTRGLAVVDPARYRVWEHHSTVQAIELKIDGAAVPLAALAPALKLVPGQRNFAIEFAAPDFTAPLQIRYTYRLSGDHANWIETDAGHRSASYGNLWPGKYTLQVRSSSRQGEWSARELAIPVEVMPAFWQTGWFFTLVLLALGSATYMGYRWRVARLRAYADGLQILVQQRTAELLEKNQQLEILSVSDRLTGLFNRLRLDHLLEEELVRSQRGSGVFSAILLDVDHFKSVNDTHGHQVGDQVLVAVAKLLKDGVRELDVAGRWGGEEFLVVCRETNLAGATLLAEKLRASFAGFAFPVVGSKTCSFGVASLGPEDDVDTLIARADAALYCAKRNGRNRVEAQV